MFVETDFGTPRRLTRDPERCKEDTPIYNLHVHLYPITNQPYLAEQQLCT
jgi:hypothetical protein